MEKEKNVVKEEKVIDSGLITEVKGNVDEYEISAFDDDNTVVASQSTEQVFKTKYSIQKTNVTVSSLVRNAIA